MKKIATITLICAGLLTGCESVPDIKSSLGLKKPAPDEFMVISNPPLTTPPDFILVAPDVESVRYSTEVIETHKGLDNSDKAFLNKIGTKTDSTVKREIDETYKNEKKVKKDKGAIRKTLDKVSGKKTDPVVDPIAEKERIKDNLAEGKSINDGDVKYEKKSTIDNILGN